MIDTVRIFLRLLSLYVAFTIVMDMPSDIHMLSIISYDQSNESVIIYILLKIFYYISLATLIWFLAPWFSRKISKKYKNDTSCNTLAMLRAGLILLSIKLIFEKSLLLVEYTFSGVTLSKNPTIHFSNVKDGDILLYNLYNSRTICASIVIVMMLLLIVNYSKVEKFLSNKL